MPEVDVLGQRVVTEELRAAVITDVLLLGVGGATTSGRLVRMLLALVILERRAVPERHAAAVAQQRLVERRRAEHLARTVLAGVLLVDVTSPRVGRRELRVTVAAVRQVGAAAEVLVVLLLRVRREVQVTVLAARHEVRLADLDLMGGAQVLLEVI